jgi:hypothetical protein
MKKIIIVVFVLFVAVLAKGQVFTDSLYFHLYNYQIITGELKTNLNLDELEREFNIESLVDSTNTETFSIFKFYHLKYEDPLTSFLIIEKDNIEIFDILSFDILIEKILDVTTIKERTKTLWIKEVLKILRFYYEDSDMERLVMRKDYGKYHYFISLKNLKNKDGIIK